MRRKSNSTNTSNNPNMVNARNTRITPASSPNGHNKPSAWEGTEAGGIHVTPPASPQTRKRSLSGNSTGLMRDTTSNHSNNTNATSSSPLTIISTGASSAKPRKGFAGKRDNDLVVVNLPTLLLHHYQQHSTSSSPASSNHNALFVQSTDAWGFLGVEKLVDNVVYCLSLILCDYCRLPTRRSGLGVGIYTYTHTGGRVVWLTYSSNHSSNDTSGNSEHGEEDGVAIDLNAVPDGDYSILPTAEPTLFFTHQALTSATSTPHLRDQAKLERLLGGALVPLVQEYVGWVKGLAGRASPLLDPLPLTIDIAKMCRDLSPSLRNLTLLTYRHHWPFAHAHTEDADERWKKFRKMHHRVQFHFIAIDHST
eukprot:gene38021-46195_t